MRALRLKIRAVLVALRGSIARVQIFLVSVARCGARLAACVLYSVSQSRIHPPIVLLAFQFATSAKRGDTVALFCSAGLCYQFGEQQSSGIGL